MKGRVNRSMCTFKVMCGTNMFSRESDNATLEIPNANQFTEGVYYCNATNTAGSRAIPTYLDISGK